MYCFYQILNKTRHRRDNNSMKMNGVRMLDGLINVDKYSIYYYIFKANG